MHVKTESSDMEKKNSDMIKLGFILTSQNPEFLTGLCRFFISSLKHAM